MALATFNHATGHLRNIPAASSCGPKLVVGPRSRNAATWPPIRQCGPAIPCFVSTTG